MLNHHHNPTPPHAQDRASRVVALFLDVITDALRQRFDGDLSILKDVRATLASRLRREFSEVEAQVFDELGGDRHA